MIETPGPLIEISVAADGEAAEAICELFERYGGGAVVELRVADGGPAAGTRSTWVRTYLPVDDLEAPRRVEVGLWHLGQIYPVPEPLLRELAEANWAEAWKEHFAPLEIGERWWVVPAWIDPLGVDLPPGARVIRLDPGMAFGTGLHPTTQLCLVALETAVQPGAAVLDVGTGSGILAIGAARLGAGRVLGVDIDAKAVEIAAANAALNGVAIELVAGSVEVIGEERFDVTVANILAATIIELARALAARVRPGGRLIVSGILAEQAEAVRGALEATGLNLSAELASGDWVALVARRAGG